MVLVKRSEDPLWGYKSYFGPQSNSKRVSAPAWGFGTSECQALLPLLPASSASPGPATYSPTLPPPPLNGPHKSCVAWGAALSPRTYTSTCPSGAPAPTKYTTCMAHMVGQVMPLANMQSTPRFSWTRSSSREARGVTYVSKGHERENLGMHSPGPHTVGRDAFASMGKQHSSQHTTQPRYAQVKAKRFMSLKAGDPSLTPGPGAYNV